MIELKAKELQRGDLIKSEGVRVRVKQVEWNLPQTVWVCGDSHGYPRSGWFHPETVIEVIERDPGVGA